jgi:hypothetical protein
MYSDDDLEWNQTYQYRDKDYPPYLLHRGEEEAQYIGFLNSDLGRVERGESPVEYLEIWREFIARVRILRFFETVEGFHTVCVFSIFFFGIVDDSD